MSLHNKLIEAHKEIARLQEENFQLRKELQYTAVNKQSPPHEKIALYRSYFRGREDVFARMWQREDGTVGYSPAAYDNEYLPLTNETFFQHLSGKQTIGLYPMLQNNTCYFLAVDFDKKDWKKDVQDFANICGRNNLPFLIERSRSGEGAHVWLFFEQAISAALARQLGDLLMEKLKEARGTPASFDRFFPSQNNLQSGGLGNLIALPLQKKPREKGNSTFVNETLTPYEDPWNHLFSINKISEAEILKVITASPIQKSSNVITPPAKLQIEINSMICLSRKEIPEDWLEDLKRIASIGNPAYFKAKAKRMSVRSISSVIEGYQLTEQHLLLPNGLLPSVRKYFNEKKVQVLIKDNRTCDKKVNFTFKGSLRLDQDEAMRRMKKEQLGMLAAGTGFGKTVVAASLIAERGVNTLVIVDRIMLLNQWKEALSHFLDVPVKDIGQIGGGKTKITDTVDLAMMQSLKNHTNNGLLEQYGQVIIDECHHVSAVSFEKVMQFISASYIHGLTATPVRKDGLHPLIGWYCGEVLYKTNPKELSKQQKFQHKLSVRETNVNLKAVNMSDIYDELSINEARNRLIFEDIMQALEEGRTPLILTERLKHLEIMKKMLKGFAKNIFVLNGNMKKKDLNEIMERMKNVSDEEEMIILSTGKFVGEGFDHPRLDSLFLTMPVGWKGTLQQYVGRLHRPHINKKEVRVYDYVDQKASVLNKMFGKRLKGYQSLGYSQDTDSKIIEKQMTLFE